MPTNWQNMTTMSHNQGRIWLANYAMPHFSRNIHKNDVIYYVVNNPELFPSVSPISGHFILSHWHPLSNKRLDVLRVGCSVMWRTRLLVFEGWWKSRVVAYVMLHQLYVGLDQNAINSQYSFLSNCHWWIKHWTNKIRLIWEIVLWVAIGNMQWKLAV